MISERIDPGAVEVLDPFVGSGAARIIRLGSGFEWHKFESTDAATVLVRETGPGLAEEQLRGDLVRIT